MKVFGEILLSLFLMIIFILCAHFIPQFVPDDFSSEGGLLKTSFKILLLPFIDLKECFLGSKEIFDCFLSFVKTFFAIFFIFIGLLSLYISYYFLNSALKKTSYLKNGLIVWIILFINMFICFKIVSILFFTLNVTLRGWW